MSSPERRSGVTSPSDAIEEILRTMDLLTIELRKGMNTQPLNGALIAWGT